MEAKILKKLILIFLILFVLAFLIYKRTSFSKEVLRLEIIAPDELSFGQEVEYLVKYKNTGKFRLEDLRLYFECPKFSTAKEGKKTSGEVSLGDLYPGQEGNFSFFCVIYGKEGEKKEAKASISFRPKNLKSRFEVKTVSASILKKIPLTFEFDFPHKIEPEKEFKFYLNYYSGLEETISNLKISVDFPLNFQLISSSLAQKEGYYEISSLGKGEGGKIEFLGKIIGEAGEEKNFKANLFSEINGELILLKETTKKIILEKPTIFLRQEINGKPDYVASPGEILHYEIYFKNIGETPLENLIWVSQLVGDAFDLSFVQSKTGFHKEGDNSIVFDPKDEPKLAFLLPMEEGKIEFWVKLKEDFKNPLIKHRIFVGGVKEEFETKIKSKLEIDQKIVYQDEIFGNSGPLPPKVGETTTYTILWQVKNYYSDTKDVKVKATLPEFVSLTNKIFPEEEKDHFSFDPKSREINWFVGELKKGEGVNNRGPILAFQISFLPQKNQKGKIIQLISDAEISGQDVFTQQNLKSTFPALTTSSLIDQGFKQEMGVVE